MLPKTRLGKRSPLGALVSSSCPFLEGPLDPETLQDQEMGVACIAMATEPGPQVTARVKVQPAQKLLKKTEHRGPPPPPLYSSSSSSSTPLASSRPHHVSSCISVPRSQRSPEEVDVDEMMAAMVLSSLSCSPHLHSPAAAPGVECGGGELSDSGSSGYWSVGRSNGSPTPSPPITEPNGGLAAPSDEGLDMELEQVLMDEPAPRKRRNSVKLVFRCLWPSCGKVLSSVVGIKRHVRITHLGQHGEQDRCSHSEEDFYYTEVHQPLPSLLSAPSPTSSPPSPHLPLACGPLGAGRADPPTDGTPPPLSRSLPSTSSSFWQVQSEHSYQVLPFRVRSVSVGEQWLQQHSAPIRRMRGEAKKCRKVYGIEHRDQWCTPCRWKKACQRFLD
ncbi:zinc finger protein 395-like [Diretmus argenteus]